MKHRNFGDYGHNIHYLKYTLLRLKKVKNVGWYGLKHKNLQLCAGFFM
jgi:hypothetical protein